MAITTKIILKFPHLEYKLKMNVNYFIFFLFNLTCVTLNAQGPFQRMYNRGVQLSVGYGLHCTRDGGFIFTGTIDSSGMGTNMDVFLVRTNQNGDTLWTRSYGRPKNDAGEAVLETSDSGFVVFGTSFNTIDRDFYLAKVDKNGNLLWNKTYGGTNDEVGRSICQTSDGGFAFTGMTYSYTKNGDCDYYIVKTNSSGDTLWTKTFGNDDVSQANMIRQTADGGYIIGGSQMEVNFYHPFLVKTNSVGAIQWQKVFDGKIHDYIYDVIQTKEGGYMVAGQTNSFGAGAIDAYLMKLKPNGDTSWVKTYGHSSSADLAKSVSETADGGYIFGGFTYSFGVGGSDMYITKTDSSGVVQWSKAVGGPNTETGNSLTLTKDGGYAMIGYTSSFGNKKQSAYLIKLDVNGNSSCQGKSVGTITGVAPFDIKSPNTFENRGGILKSLTMSENRGCVIFDPCASSGLPSLKEVPLFHVFPNPVNSAINIEGVAQSEITILDMLGKVIYTTKANDSDLQINCAGYPEGIYFIKALKGNEIFTQKIVIRH